MRATAEGASEAFHLGVTFEGYHEPEKERKPVGD